MADVLFVSKEDIIRKSPYVDGNLDADKIIPALHLAQVQYLKEITGTDLYNKLSSDVSAFVLSGTTIPANYKNLLDDYIKPILIHLTLAEFLKSASITVSNKGVFKHQSENSTSLTDKELKELIQVERDRAESYTERFIDHMLFNAPTKFPAIYCESYWGDNNRSFGWGEVYPLCNPMGVDRTDLTIDETLEVTIDMS